MTIKSTLARATEKLVSKHISSARLDAEVLLGFILKRPREFLLAHDDRVLKPSEQKLYTILINRRAKYEPVAYIIGTKYFYGLQLKVNNKVLIPRPETEQLVELALQFGQNIKQPKFIDVGCGSGAIAIALKQTQPNSQVLALDSNTSALALTRSNAKKHHLSITVIKSDLLAKAPMKWLGGSILAVNLPYVAKSEIKNFPLEIKQGLKYEPASAIFAPASGTAVYEKFFRQLVALPKVNQPTILIAEIGSTYAKKFLDLANKYFVRADIKLQKDYAGRPRFLIIRF